MGKLELTYTTAINTPNWVAIVKKKMVCGAECIVRLYNLLYITPETIGIALSATDKIEKAAPVKKINN